MNLGTNSNSKLEIVSTLNIQLQNHYAYYYNSSICLSKYNPKVHLGTVETIGLDWLYERTNQVLTHWPERKNFNNAVFLVYKKFQGIFIINYPIIKLRGNYI